MYPILGQTTASFTHQ